jgi:hypothetical protein
MTDDDAARLAAVEAAAALQ